VVEQVYLVVEILVVVEVEKEQVVLVQLVVVDQEL
jgi:hypothetical protein